MRELLENAWTWREKHQWMERTEALRVFHGTGEGKGELSQIAIEKFGDHYWVTEWEKSNSSRRLSDKTRNEIAQFLKSKKGASAVLLERPQKEVPSEPQILFGIPPEKLSVREAAGSYWIRFEKTKHPGLFLDHYPLREWLFKNVRGMRVLNTFAYTGSLSVAAGLGRAEKVVTLDLSKPTIHWAQENWSLNQLKDEAARFIHGDYFEWLPRLKRSGEMFDCVILDPPSFSRGDKGNFSTSKDLQRLHERALEILNPGGLLITSINSANVSWSKYESEVIAAARSSKTTLTILRQIQQPETFPTTLADPSSRYLKGWILKKGDK